MLIVIQASHFEITILKLKCRIVFCPIIYDEDKDSDEDSDESSQDESDQEGPVRKRIFLSTAEISNI